MTHGKIYSVFFVTACCRLAGPCFTAVCRRIRNVLIVSVFVIDGLLYGERPPFAL